MGSRYNKALSAICQDYMFGSTKVMNMTHTITYPDILPKTKAALKTAQENYDNVLDLMKNHKQILAEKIANAKAGLATNVNNINEQNLEVLENNGKQIGPVHKRTRKKYENI